MEPWDQLVQRQRRIRSRMFRCRLYRRIRLPAVLVESSYRERINCTQFNECKGILTMYARL